MPNVFNRPVNIYYSAKISIIAVLDLATIMTFALVSMYHKENSRRAEVGDSGQGINDSSFLDLTDRQKKEFRVSAI